MGSSPGHVLSEGGEVARVDGLQIEGRVGLYRLDALPLRGERGQVPAGVREGRGVDGRGPLDAGRRLQSGHHVLEELEVARRIFVFGWELEIDEDQPVGGQAELDGLESEQAAGQETGRRDHGDREGDLENDQRLAAARPLAPPLPSALELSGDVETLRAEDGRDGGQKRGEKRHGESERDHGGVDADGVDARESVRQTRQHGPQHPPRRDQSGDAAGEREEKALHDELARQAARAGPERRAHGDLRLPRHAPKEQQVRHVRARDGEHDGHRDEEHDQGRAGVADDDVLEPPHDGRRALRCVVLRPHLEVIRQGLHLARRLLDRRVGPQSPDQVDLIPHAPPECFLPKRRRHGVQRGPGLDTRRVLEVPGHDAHDRERLSAQDLQAADHVPRAAVPALPQAAGDDEDVLGARRVVARIQHPTEDGPDPDHTEEVARDARGADPTVLRRQPECAVVADPGHALQRSGVVTDHVDVRSPEGPVVGAPRARLGPGEDQPVLLGDGERAQEHCLNEREHGGRARNPQGQGENGGSRECSRPPQALAG